MRQLWPKVVLIGGGLVISALLGATLLRPREPVYNGQPLSYWFERLQRPNPEAARVEIHEIGSQAVPFLLEKVRKENSVGRKWYRNAWAKIPLSLRRLLPTPPKLQMQSRVYQALHVIGPPAVPPLVAAFTDLNREIKLLAVSVVRSLEEPSSETVQGLIRLLKDPDREVRGNAILALDRMGPYRQEALPALITALGDKYSGPRFGVAGNVRELAEWTLGRIGPDAAAAIPALTPLLEDWNARTREEAATALARIQRDTNSVDLAVNEFARTSDSEACERLLLLFGEMGPLAKSAAPLILAKLNRPGQWSGVLEPKLREVANQVVAIIDPEAGWETHSVASPVGVVQPRDITDSSIESKSGEPIAAKLFDESPSLIPAR